MASAAGSGRTRPLQSKNHMENAISIAHHQNQQLRLAAASLNIGNGSGRVQNYACTMKKNFHYKCMFDASGLLIKLMAE